MTTLKEDLPLPSGPDVFGLRRWDRDWMTTGITWAQGRLGRAVVVLKNLNPALRIRIKTGLLMTFSSANILDKVQSKVKDGISSKSKIT